MRLNITGDNLEITNQMKLLTVEKLGQDLEKYLPDLNQEIKTAEVVISRHTRWGYEVNFRMRLPEKYDVFAEAHKESIESALVAVREKVEVQLRRYEGRLEGD